MCIAISTNSMPCDINLYLSAVWVGGGGLTKKLIIVVMKTLIFIYTECVLNHAN